MPILRETTIKNVGPIEEATFKIEPGLSVVYGLNLASGKNSENGNAVGKSLLFSSLAETIRGTPIIGERGDRIQEGQRSARWVDHIGNEIVVRRTANGRGDKLELFENDHSLDFRTVAASKEYIDQRWPLSDVDYITYVHIDSRAPHPLVMGSSTQRKEFFTDFFRMEILDAERKLYNAYSRDLKNARAVYDEVNSQYASIQARLLSPEERAQAEHDRDTLHEKLEELEAKVSSIQNIARLIQFGKSAEGHIKTLTQAYGKISVERLDDVREELKEKAKALDAQLAQAKAWENYQRDTKRYSQAYDELSDAAKDAIEEFGYDDALEQAENAAQQAMKLKAQIDSINEQLDKLEILLDEKLPEKVEAPDEDEEDLRVLERTYKHHIEHAKKFGSGVCDTCGQAVQTRDPEEVKERLSAVREKLSRHENARTYVAAVKLLKERTNQFNELSEKVEGLMNERSKFAKLAKLHKELRDLPSKPEPFEGEKLDAAPIEAARIDITSQMNLIKFIYPHIDTVEEFLALTQEQKDSVNDISELSEKVRSTRERYTEAQSKLRVEESLSEQLSELKARDNELEEKLKDEARVKVLVDAYSDKNIKKLVVEQIGARLMTLINTYSQQVFEEKYRFEFVWDTEISILVHRPNGKTSDVRKLSGAESTLFTIILVCALMSFVPAHKRCNFMILDEPTSHMSAHNKEILHNALKLLTGLIPSIILITPKMEERYEGAREFTVVKGKDGISRLERGHPDEFRGK
jgi:DNA repair exonuclease SbcCD ATPase subunit